MAMSLKFRIPVRYTDNSIVKFLGILNSYQKNLFWILRNYVDEESRNKMNFSMECQNRERL